MSYNNCSYGCGSGCGSSYTLEGSSCSANYEVKAGIEYARSYSPSSHENFTELKYSKTSADYDNHTREIIESIQGNPLESYIPRGPASNTGSAVPKTQGEVEVIHPAKIQERQILDEIIKAQQEVSGRKIIFREVEIEEQITIKRKIKKKTISFINENPSL